MKRKAKKIGAPGRKGKALGKSQLKKVSGGVGRSVETAIIIRGERAESPKNNYGWY